MSTKKTPSKSLARVKVTSAQHKEDLKILETLTPQKLVKAVVQGFGVQKLKERKL